MTVHHQAYAQETVQQRVGRTACHECRSSKRYEAGGEQTFERPVVRAMCSGGWGEGSRVVHRALVNSCYMYMRMRGFREVSDARCTYDHLEHRKCPLRLVLYQNTPRSARMFRRGTRRGGEMEGGCLSGRW